jgi:hypothetical protein
MSRFLVGIVVEHGRMIEVIIEAKDHGDARVRLRRSMERVRSLS